MNDKKLSLARSLLAQARQNASAKGRGPLSKKRLGRKGHGLFEYTPRSSSSGAANETELRAADGSLRADVGPGLPADAGRAHYGPYDPQPLGKALRNLTSARRWERPLLAGQVVAEWEKVVGESIAKHCRIVSFEDGELQLAASSTAWAQQLRLLIPQIMKKLNQRYGAGVVEKLVVRGPAQRSWKHGYRSVRGRGPRDTYG